MHALYWRVILVNVYGSFVSAYIIYNTWETSLNTVANIILQPEQ